MKEKILTGEQAIAYGALSSGIKMATAYPGSPGTNVTNTLIDLAGKFDLYVEWSSNEKVALEMCIGASIAGRRSLICTKSVGMNALIDPLMTLNLTGVNAGLVILLGDDPGAYGSQNDQDTRPVALLTELPMLEPATPQEGFRMMQEAFALSEKFNTAIIIRITRSFTSQTQPVSLPDVLHPDVELPLKRETGRFVPSPRNAVEKHRELHARLAAFRKHLEELPFHQHSGQGDFGILSVGFVHQKLMNVLGDPPPPEVRILGLGYIFPLSEGMIAEFLSACREVVILEEIGPMVEMQVKTLAFEIGWLGKFYGKRSGHIPAEGELYRWQIREALLSLYPHLELNGQYSRENAALEIPQKKDHCAGCTYGEIFDVIDEAAALAGQRPLIIGDPSCLVTVADRLDAKFAIGSAVAIASGLTKAGIKERAIAVFGDSSFFHTSIPAICNAVHNQSNLIMLVLDNQASATTGFQPNPGVNRNAMGEKAPALHIETIAKACGVAHVNAFAFGEPYSTLKQMILQALQHPGQSLILIQTKFRDT